MTKYVTLTNQSSGFFFCPDGLTLVPRASILIDKQCPDAWKSIIAEAAGKGWISVQAHMRDTEYTMELLTK